MKRNKKRMLSLLLSLSLCIGIARENSIVNAAEPDSYREMNTTASQIDDLEISGNNDAGDLIASAISQQYVEDEAQASSGNSLTGLEVTGNIATVSYNINENAIAEIVVAIYDENSKQMLASGKEVAFIDRKSVDVMLDITVQDMPTYFIATAFLLDAQTHAPLGDSLTIQMHTKSIQDLLGSSVLDYEEAGKDVINFDSDNSTNFAVYNDSTLVMGENSDSLDINDNGDGSYTINNAPDQIKNLKENDTFSYTYNNGNILLITVAKIKVSDTTVTIWKSQEADLGEFFDCVKIEETSAPDSIEVDNSDISDGLFPVDGPQSIALTGDVSDSYSWEPYSLKEESGGITLTGSINFGIVISLKYYLAKDYQSVSVTLDYSANLEIHLSGNWNKEYSLGDYKAVLLGGAVTFGFKPSVVVECEVKIDWTNTIKGRMGFSYDTENGMKNLSENPTYEQNLQMEGRLYIGIKATPYVTFLWGFCSASFNGDLGVEFTVKLSQPSETHSCLRCFEGEITLPYKLEASAKLLWGVFQSSATLIDDKEKLADFYYSIDYGDFGWGMCPHKTTQIDGTSVYWNLNGDGTLRITGNGKIPSGQFAENTEIRKVIIEDGITTIGQGAFDKCINLESIDFPKTLQRIYEIAFRYCSKLKSIELPEGVIEIQSEAFGECDSLSYVKWPSSLTYIDQWMFLECYSLKDIELPNTLEYIYGDAFFRSGLESIDLPDSLKSIGSWAFAETKIKNIVIPDRVTDTGTAAFQDCMELESVTLPENLTFLGQQTFMNCGALKTIYFRGDAISNRAQWVFDNVTATAYYPKGNSTWVGAGTDWIWGDNITWEPYDLDLSLDNVSMSEELIDETAFAESTVLSAEDETERFERNEMDSNDSLTSPDDKLAVSLQPEISEIDSIIPEASEEKEYDSGILAVISDSVTEIGESEFSSREDLVNIKIPDGVISVGNYAFQNCKNLISIHFSNSVNRVGSFAFSECINLEEVYFCGDRPEFVSADDGQSHIFDGTSVIAYYPKNNDTWDEIERLNLGGEIVWTPYDFENGASGEQTETQLNQYDDVTSETADNLADSYDLEISVDLSDEEESQANEIVEDGNYTVSDDAKGNGDEVIIEESHMEVFASSQASSNSYAESFSDLVPGAAYTFIVVNNVNAEDLLASSNLLYIAQGYSNAEGIITFIYNPKNGYSGTAEIYGSHVHNYGNPSFKWTGTDQCMAIFTCSECGHSYNIGCKVAKKNGSSVCNGTVYTATAEFNNCTYTDTQTVVAKGHLFDSWKTISSATVFAAEVQRHICTVCNYSETRTVGTKLKPTIKLNATKFPLKVNQSTTKLKVSGLATGDSIKSWKSSNKKIVTVSKSGKIKAKKKTGKATITVTLSSGKKANVKVTVQKGAVKTTKISGLPKKVKLRKGKKMSLKPILTPITSTDKITYTTSNKKIVTVNKKGLLTAKKAGTAKIKVKAGKKSFTVTVRVTKK